MIWLWDIINTCAVSMSKSDCEVQWRGCHAIFNSIKQWRMCNEKIKPVNDQECVLLYAVCGLMETLRSTHWSDELEEYMKSLRMFMKLPKEKDEVADTSRSRWLHSLQQFVLVTDVGHANERYRMGCLYPDVQCLLNVTYGCPVWWKLCYALLQVHWEYALEYVALG